MSDEETPTTPEPSEATAAPEPTVEAPAEAPVAAAPVAEETVADAPTQVAAPVAAAPDVAPVAPVAPAAEPQPEPVAAMASPAPVAPVAPVVPVVSSEEPKRRGVFVPAWAAAIVVLLIVAAVGFGVGRWTSDDSSTASAPIASNGGIIPQLPNGNGNGGQNTPSTSTAFLGVATENATGGVAIVSVGDNTPADGAGLEVGDVITAVNDTDVSSPAELVQAIQSHDPGDQVTIHYTRDGDEESVKVTLGTRSQTNPN